MSHKLVRYCQEKGHIALTRSGVSEHALSRRLKNIMASFAQPVPQVPKPEGDIPLAQAVPAEVPPALLAWAKTIRLRDVATLAAALDELGIYAQEDMIDMDTEMIDIVGAKLKMMEAKKFRKGIEQLKAAAEEESPAADSPAVDSPVAAAAADAGEAKQELPPMSAEEAKVIEEALAKMANGETALWLRDNQIGDVGASKIADVLPQSKLTQLGLWDNFQIGDVGAIAIADALSQSKLTSFTLCGTSIGDVSASKIADALPQSKLTSLNLVGNQIGDAGAIAIAWALPQSKLTNLDLGRNQIGVAVKQRLEQCKNAEGKSIRMYL